MDHIRDTHFQDVKNSMFGRPREFQCNECRLVQTTYSIDYRPRAFVTRGLYTYFSLRFILQSGYCYLLTIYVLNREILQFLGLKTVVYNQERVMMARVRLNVLRGRSQTTLTSFGFFDHLLQVFTL